MQTPDIRRLVLIEQRLTAEAKSPLLAYLLLLLLGWTGMHRFYLGRMADGAAMLGLSALGALSLAAGIGAAPLAILGFWCLADLFLVRGMIRAGTDNLRARLVGSMTPARRPATG